MDFLADLEARGLIQDSTDRDALRARITAGQVGVYYGCDPSADSLQVGNLIGLLVLRRFADAGHRPVALAGGATGMIGDRAAAPRSGTCSTPRPSPATPSASPTSLSGSPGCRW
jgi:tyrosyl-tRNA synthetase